MVVVGPTAFTSSRSSTGTAARSVEAVVVEEEADSVTAEDTKFVPSSVEEIPT